jgi:hypothetical protein
MTVTPATVFQAFLRDAESDPNILGCFLSGSRGKGFEHNGSDYDLSIVVDDDVVIEYSQALRAREVPGVDLWVRSLSELREYAGWLSETHWDRYDFAHVRALIDKTGEIQTLIDDKGSVPPAKKDAFVNAQLDGYLNGFFRSVKSFARGEAVGMRLEAAMSLPYLLNALFALHDRATPFPDYLTRDLAGRPLEKWPWPTDILLGRLLTILDNGDVPIQQELAKTVDRVFRRAGYDRVFDDWTGRDRWAMEFH